MAQRKTQKKRKIPFGPNRLKRNGAGAHGGTTKQKVRRKRKETRQEMKNAAQKGGGFLCMA
jgi:hypothetical protein